MRLDKLVATAALLPRREASQLIRKGQVCVDGVCLRKADANVDEKKSTVTLSGRPLRYREFIYLEMNKPQGLLSATDDKLEKTVLSLLPEPYQNRGLFPAGRLDKDTVGLLILTNDGESAHRLLSPRHHVEKDYYVECDGAFTEEDVRLFAEGITLDGEKTKPALLRIDGGNPNTAHVTLTEGKYHEIKRLCHACGKNVTFLERVRFGAITLDPSLSRGEWRELSDEEIKALLASEEKDNDRT